MENMEVVLSQETEQAEILKVEVEKTKTNNAFNIVICVVSAILAVALLIMFFIAAASVKTGGLEIMSIESVGGKTLEEAYYHDLGFIYEGYCLAIQAMGVFCSSVLALFGVSRLKNGK